MLPAAVHAQVAALPLQSCVNVATQAVTQGLQSTNYLEGVIPSCTVTIYISGTQTLATYYTSIGGSPNTGPFTASSTGQWLAFVSTLNSYDVVLSGGIAPNVYQNPVTITGLAVSSGGGSSYPPLICALGAYTTVAEAANACNATVIAQGGGTWDARQMMSGGTFTHPIQGDEEIDCGSPSTGGGLPGVSCLFPNSSVYATSQVGGPVYAAQPYQSTTEGSGYTVGCTVTAPETGYGYTGTATGAVLTVSAVTGGAVTALTIASAGSGYLSSSYVPASNTGGTCTGSGLILRLQAKDSAIRVWSSSAAKTDSVGGGGATFVIEPYYPSGCPGYPVMDAGLSTPRVGGYQRIEGGFKIADNGCQAFTYAAFRAQGQVDSARNLLIETSTPHDNGIYMETECCSGDNQLLHADTNGQGGTPVIVAGESILNACTTNGSSNVYFPYGIPSIAWLGSVISGTGIPNNTIVGSLTAPSGAFPASVNLTTATGAPVNATATSTGAGACTTPSVSTGSGVSLKLANPTDVSGQLQTISIRNLVPNDPGLGLPLITIGNSSNSITFDTVYGERNTLDTYTPGIYVSNSSFVSFHNVRGCGATNAYCVKNDTPAGWDWSATNMATTGLGYNDSGTVYTNSLGLNFFKYLATGNLFMSTFPTFALTGPYNNTSGATAIVNCPPTGGSSTTFCGGDGAWHSTSVGAAVTTGMPAWLQYVGVASATETCNGVLSGDQYYGTFSVPNGNTCTVNSTVGLTVHAATCSVVGTLTGNSATVSGAATAAIGGGSGGGSGYGNANGTAGGATYLIATTASPVTAGGSAGTSGVSGGNGSTPIAQYENAILNSGAATDGLFIAGGVGKVGQNSGGAAGNPGAGITLICGTLTFTDGTHQGTVTATGGNGGAGGSNTGGGSAGGGGVLILASQSAYTGTPTLTEVGGTGGAIGTGTSTAGGNGGGGWQAVCNPTTGCTIASQ
jgi:hypothetical protein